MSDARQLRPIDAVFFDFSGTLLSVEPAADWLVRAATPLGLQFTDAESGEMIERLIRSGRPGGPAPTGLSGALAELYAARDLTPEQHREAYVALMARADLPDPRLAEALYDAMFPPEAWVPYPDAPHVLETLHAHGIKVAVVSNIAHDLRPTFDHHGLTQWVDAFVFSYEVDAMKPSPKIFAAACEAVGVEPERALMVGDTLADAGAAESGIQALVLPASPPGEVHGLAAVLALAGL
ncbi:HAD family hydrolase [Cryptosporangium phraense]|uniref:HAD-IA family hydrolase n=1 Tax=Cryptosporangium phraense TaxID=2593070 RepID=A0A545AZG6_9ACTN|nr:HAD-IA family hydrolase [Cryptosporangium phraense]TQS46731.1 HAD-IA family hydrolase [Cryptosporangium phraense]